jgi:hypothetical protein
LIFVYVDLVPRLLQREEDPKRTIATNSDALLARLSMVGGASAVRGEGNSASVAPTPMMLQQTQRKLSAL